MATQSAINTGKPIEVFNGGTGIATTTAYGVMTGGTTSTSALQNAGTGTTGQVLTSTGSSSLPVWAASTSVGSWVLISTMDGGGNTWADFTSGITSTYNNYVIVCSKVDLTTAGVNLICRYSTDGGSTFVATNYQSGVNSSAYNSTTISNSNSTTAFLATGPLDNDVSNTTASAVIWIMNLTAGSGIIRSSSSSYSYNSGNKGGIGAGVNTNTSQTGNALRVGASDGGGIVAGIFSLYGIIK